MSAIAFAFFVVYKTKNQDLACWHSKDLEIGEMFESIELQQFIPKGFVGQHGWHRVIYFVQLFSKRIRHICLNVFRDHVLVYLSQDIGDGRQYPKFPSDLVLDIHVCDAATTEELSIRAYRGERSRRASFASADLLQRVRRKYCVVKITG